MRISESVGDRGWPEREPRRRSIGIATTARARVVKGGAAASACGAARAPRSSTRPLRVRRLEARRELPDAVSRRSAAAHLVHTPATASRERRPARLARPVHHSRSGPLWTRRVHRRATIRLRAEQAQTNFCATIGPRAGPSQAPDLVSDVFPVRGGVVQGSDPFEDRCSV